jgi:hypothetical protein
MAPTNPPSDRGKNPNAGKKAEYADKIRKTRKDEAEFLTSFELKKKNLERVQGEYKGGINSKFKGEFEKAKREFDIQEKQKVDYQKRLKDLNDEFDNMEDETWSSGPGVKGEPLEQVVLPPVDSNTTPPQVTNPPLGEGPTPTVEVTDEREEMNNGREGGPLYTLDDLRKALGQEEMGTVVAWRQAGGNQRVVISRYGPRKARKYRLQKAADADGSWQEDKVDMYTKKSLRFGAMKDDNNKFIHGGSEAKGIVAVAWYFNDDDEEPEKLMLPKTRPKPTPGTRRAPLYVECQSMVQWEIDGEEKFSWETRDTIVRLYKSATTADNLIYLYAQYQGVRHREWKRTERKSEDRSPTPMPGLLRPVATPEPEEVDKKPVATSSGGTSDEDKESAAKKRWALKRKLDPDRLSDANEARFDVYYEAFKVAAVAEVAAAA